MSSYEYIRLKAIKTALCIGFCPNHNGDDFCSCGNKDCIIKKVKMEHISDITLLDLLEVDDG